MNSTDKAYKRDLLLLELIDSDCMVSSAESVSDYDKSISEYLMLINDRIQHNDLKEVANLRRDLQRCRAEKRNFKRLNKHKEIALT